MFGGNGFWTPTENKPAMKAFAGSLRRRSQRRERPSGTRFVLELVAVVLVAGGIYLGLELVL